MKIVRQIIIGLSVLVGCWVGISFVGVMFNIGNAEFWTVSLMWALLASVFVMPGLVIAHHASQRTRKQAEREHAQRTMQPTAFVDETERGDALWPSDAETKNQK